MLALLLSFAALTVLHHHLLYRFAAANVITLFLMVTICTAFAPFLLMLFAGSLILLFNKLKNCLKKRGAPPEKVNAVPIKDPPESEEGGRK